MALCAPPPPLGCGMFGLGGLFTAAELAVADQLVQLSGSGGDEEASPSSSSTTTTTSSLRSVNTCAAAASREEEFTWLAAGGMELDRRARKRYRLLSELYAATAPVKRGDACGKRKRYEYDDPEPEPEIAMWYGES
ncbi:hypothetical protein GUJ93_ZPchr0002g25257 [Zizania palustris]|uniref:Uncharacterized protein n=1 Tax=Zizania palustris TaxID=103762 RepID=A0A8J5V3U2_ZIZPA|nr:hypothetical protein GUJ93_ZPchr0002g25257 [Zizania palustris]